MIYLLLAALIVAGIVYVRLAPHDVARWHVPLGAAEDAAGAGWASRVVPASPGALARIHRAALDLPRTELLAGSVGEKHLTYVTRSAVFGFPDYTTVQQHDARLMLYARLRFGRSDFGVNAARIERLIAAAEARG